MKGPLPTGWTQITLADHIYIAGRIGWRGLKADEYTPSGPILLSVPNLNHGDEVDFGRVSHIAEARYKESPEIQIKIGDTLLVKDGAGIGKLGYVASLPGPSTVNSSLLVVRPQDGLFLHKYLFYYLKGPDLQNIAQQRITGSATPHLFQKDIKTFNVVVPPIAEQSRLVAKLDAALARFRASKQRLDKVPKILKRFRQAVLAAACSGKLTADWRRDNPASQSAAIFVRQLQNLRKDAFNHQRVASAHVKVVKPKRPPNNFAAEIEEGSEDLPASWCRTRIGDISDCLDHLRVPVNKDERLARSGPIPYYGANGQVGYIDDFLFDEDLVLVVEDETFIGRTKPFSYLIHGKAWVNNHAHVLRPLGGMRAEYLNICLSYYDFTPLTSGTTGRRKLTQEALVVAPFNLAPVAEQNEIVLRVEELFAFADRLEARLEKATGQLERLTQSVLAKAFRGELVPTEAELAAAEGRKYESAEELLNRILAQTSSNGRSGLPKKKTSKRT